MEPPEQLKNSVIVAHEVIEQILTQSSELIYQSRVCLQMKLLKAKQQERLLEIAVNQSKISEKGEILN